MNSKSINISDLILFSRLKVKLPIQSQIIEMRDSRNFSGGLVTNRRDVNLPPNLHDFRIIDITMVPIVCYFPKNSYLVKAFNEKIKMPAGIFGHLMSSHLIYSPSNGTQNGHRTMTLEMLFGAFEILFTGWIVAFFAFLFELFKTNLNRRRLVK